MLPPRGIEYFVQGPYYKCAGSLKDPSIQEYDKLLTLVKKRQLRWFGNVTMSSGLAKMTLQDTVKSEIQRSRQKNRWEEWTGMGGGGGGGLPAQLGQLKTRQDLKGLLQSHF